MIGNTPLLLVPEHVHGIPNLILYAKLEYQNPFGSLKDRFAWHSIKDHVHELASQPSCKILESSSGNTIKAIGGIASTFGIPSKTITNRIKIQEQADILTWMGTEIEQLPSDGECIDLTQQHNAVQLIEKECENNIHYLHTDQYRNTLNTKIHEEHTGPEIYDDMPNIDYFFGSLGTTGSSGGVTNFLKSKNHELTSIGVVSDNHDFIPGIRNSAEMSEVGIFDRSLYDDIIEINALTALDATRQLTQQVGMMCGPTTGAVYRGIRDYFARHPITDGQTKIGVFIACDRVEPYMSYIKQRMPTLFHQDHKHCILTITPDDQKRYTQSLSVEKLNTMRQESPHNILLLDVRSTKAFVLGHIPGSINIPLDILTDLTDKGNIFDKDKKIILLCPLGKQTKKLCAYLNMSGFDAYSLEGGLRAWKNKNKR